MEHIEEKNRVLLVGKALSGFVFDHKVHGEGFYSFILEIKRLSNNVDCIPILISERILGEKSIAKDDNVGIEGQFRSYNNYHNEGNKLVLSVFAKSIDFMPAMEDVKTANQIYLDGFICKKPIFRTTPFGREIADMLIAVHRTYNKSDYIPCIAWGRNARYANDLEIGDNIKIFGRIQSREYQKKTESGKIIQKTAYEVSISEFEL